MKQKGENFRIFVFKRKKRNSKTFSGFLRSLSADETFPPRLCKDAEIDQVRRSTRVGSGITTKY
jgi:hypothetical protein